MPADYEDQIKILEEKLLTPAVRKSPEDLELLLADDFIEFGSSGTLYNKARVISVLGDEAPHEISIENFQAVNLSPDTVLATYISVKDGNKNSKALRSSIWKLIDGKWQILFHQGTPIKE